LISYVFIAILPMKIINEATEVQLSRFLERRGLTQQALADALDIPKNTVWRWVNEKVTPSAEMLQRLASYFNVSVDELLNGPAPTEIEIRLVMSFEPMKGGITALDMKEGNSFTLCVEDNRLGIIGVGPLKSEEDIDEFLGRAKHRLMVELFAQEKAKEGDGK
jgi:plasmid maintenance system antidote protein VapI